MANESLIYACTPNGERRIVVLRGLPGSGKSTFAINAVTTFPGLVARINNDDLAYAVFGKTWTPELKNSSKILKRIREDIIKNLLENSKVEIIIIDNTNLHRAAFSSLSVLATEYGVSFIVDDTFLGVPVEECIKRDALRAHPVGAEVIRSLASRLEN